MTPNLRLAGATGWLIDPRRSVRLKHTMVLESLITACKDLCATSPNQRKGENTHYDMADIGMAAFSTFVTQSLACFSASIRRSSSATDLGICRAERTPPA